MAKADTLIELICMWASSLGVLTRGTSCAYCSTTSRYKDTNTNQRSASFRSKAQSHVKPSRGVVDGYLPLAQAHLLLEHEVADDVGHGVEQRDHHQHAEEPAHAAPETRLKDDHTTTQQEDTRGQPY